MPGHRDRPEPPPAPAAGALCDVCSATVEVPFGVGAGGGALTLRFGQRVADAGDARLLGVQLHQQVVLERGTALQLHGVLLQLLQPAAPAAAPAPPAPAP